MNRIVPALAALVVALAVVPAPAAAESRTGGVVTVGPDETVSGDLEAFGGTVVVAGTVEGDVEAVGGTVRITGDVGGDVDAAGGNVVIDGVVDGSVHAAGGEVRVGEDARIGEDLEAAGGGVTVDGTVGGDAALSADEISLGPTASIAGALTYEGDLDRHPGAAVGGPIERTGDAEVQVGFGPGSLPTFGDANNFLLFYGVMVNLLVGAVLLAALPGLSREVRATAEGDPIRAGGAGAVALVAVPGILILLAVTIVGVPLSLAGLLLFLLVAWAGALWGRYVLGAWLLSHVDVDNRWVGLLVGVGLVAAARALPVPFVGDLVRAAVFLLGFGALTLVAYRRYEARRGDESAAEPVVEGDEPVSPGGS